MDESIRRIAEQAAETNKDLFYFWKYEWSFYEDGLSIDEWLSDGAPRLYGED